MYIARFRSNDLKKQPLKDHITNVAKLAKSFGKKVDLSRTMELLGYIHDMGKYSDHFQKYIQKVCLENKKFQDKPDHGVYGAKFIYEKIGNGHTEYFQEIFALVIAYHHGGLPDCEKGLEENTLEHRITNPKKTEDFLIVYNRFRSEIKIDLETLFDESCKEMEKFLCKLAKLADREFQINLIVKLIYSMLIDADRLDSMCFKEDINIQHYIESKNNVWNKYSFIFEDYIRQLEKTLNNDVDKIRSQISEECLNYAKNAEGIYTLTVPTGGGKTLASMRFALQHNKIQKKQRIIYIIPYTTIIEQNAEVIRKALNYKCDLLEHHSNIVEDNEQEDYKLLTERWENDIVFTTMVQFLNTFYGKGTQDVRRLHNMMNATIIFDEVQTVPVKSMALFNSAINFLYYSGNSTIILCTATQPGLNQCYGVRIQDIKGEIISDIKQRYKQLRRVKIVNQCKEQEYTLEEATEFILNQKQKVKSLLMVVNKIKTAEYLYKNLKMKTKSNIMFLSSNLCAEHRKDVLKKLKEELEEKSDIICISTSLIEAGVDISFEVAIRSNTKLDSIAQVAGRVNRNGNNNIGYCYIINLNEGSYDKMLEIRIGGERTRTIFRNYPMEEVLNPKIIEQYFKEYFLEKEIQKNFYYPFEDKRTHQTKEIYDLLNRKNIKKNYV